LPPLNPVNTVSNISDRSQLAEFLGKKPALNAYLLGDLDERYWSRTKWFAVQHGKQIQEIALLYSGMNPPILIAIPNSDPAQLKYLLEEIQPQLPAQVYAHLGPDLSSALDRYQLKDQPQPHFAMELTNPSAHQSISTTEIISLQKHDFEDTRQLFDASYPGHWFREEMLGFGPYFGYRDASGQLLAAGGVHVFSETYQVATIGNVVTHPSARGQGWASKVNARLLADLSERVETIALNVHAKNSVAIQLYENLGFSKLAEYFEMHLIRK
jgi:ribosomal protein S18 acetylase RimI-like enzyme